MRPKKHSPTGAGDLFRARLDQIIDMRHELASRSAFTADAAARAGGPC